MNWILPVFASAAVLFLIRTVSRTPTYSHRPLRFMRGLLASEMEEGRMSALVVQHHGSPLHLRFERSGGALTLRLPQSLFGAPFLESLSAKAHHQGFPQAIRTGGGENGVTLDLEFPAGGDSPGEVADAAYRLAQFITSALQVAPEAEFSFSLYEEVACI